MSNAHTPLQRLLGPDGEFDQRALAAATDDQVRAAVIQAIDALERLSDVGDLFSLLNDEWGMPGADSSRFDRLIEDRRATDPIDGGLPDNGYCMSTPSGTLVVSQATREQLMTGLASLHRSIRQYQAAAHMITQAADAACRGEYVQSEFDKADARAEQAATTRPSTPRP